MPLTTAKLSLGSAGLDLPSARRSPTERPLTLTDLPRNAMAIVGASLSKDDIEALCMVSREVCSLATACMKACTIWLDMELATLERLLERYAGVPHLTVIVSWQEAHLLWARGLLPRMQVLRLLLHDSADSKHDEAARILQRATRLTSLDITGVDGHGGLRLAANCLALQSLYFYCEEKSTIPVDFRQLSALTNLQSLTFWDFGESGDLSSITCLTGLTELDIVVGREVSLRPLAHLPRLISLWLNCEAGGNLPEDFVLSCLAAECRGKLKSLKLWHFGSATAEAVRHLALCTSLVCLELQIIDNLPRLADVEPMLKGLPHLEECVWKYEEWARG